MALLRDAFNKGKRAVICMGSWQLTMEYCVANKTSREIHISHAELEVFLDEILLKGGVNLAYSINMCILSF